MNIRARLWNLLGRRSTCRVLLWLNALVTVGVFIAFREPHGGDIYTYEQLADGLLHGKYSLWWQLPIDVPDTLRNPGYPLFLAAFRAFTTNELPVQIVQALLFSLSVHWNVRLIRRFGGGNAAVSIFLLLLLPSINIAFYNTSLYPETLTLFLITAFLQLATSGPLTWKRSLLMGLLLGAAFQCRSSLIYLPLAWSAVTLFADRRMAVAGQLALVLLAFITTTVPYGLWNLEHHGRYSITPLEGGAGVIHMGWWTGRIPGHKDSWYWGNFASVEVVEFVPPEQVPAEIEAYNEEWRAIDRAIAPLMSATDTAMQAAQRTRPELFKTFNTQYTLERERLLNEATIRNVKDKPGYTLLHSAYTAVRLWVTGVQMDKFRGASAVGKVAILYPFLVSLVIFALGTTLIPWALWRHRGLWKRWLTPLVLCIYFGGVHIPAHIQARYTIPVRLVFHSMIALAIVLWHERHQLEDSTGRQVAWKAWQQPCTRHAMDTCEDC